MPTIDRATARAHHAALRLLQHGVDTTGSRHRGSPERGDVPGWVLITLMTAGLVTAIWAVASDQLVAMFQRSLNSVTGP